MHPANYTFVALDLETTGLSPETDTIIEIAAIRFQIEKVGDTYTMTDVVEHSQLIHPGRALTQEISLITGITPAMLDDKPSWDSVREKVREFIGDAVIVGHNVLFDIAMLASHGIDVSSNTVIDTFELSEIFSQDVESLNLGFLANRYGLIDPSEEEHRALTDTRVSIRLLLRYLGEVERITGKKRQIWDMLSIRDESHTLAILSEICHEKPETDTAMSDLFVDLISEPLTPHTSHDDSGSATKNSQNCEISLLEINNTRDELTLIEDTLRAKEKITLVTPGYKVANWMSGLLTKQGIDTVISITPDKWCSVEYMREIILSDRLLGRKEMILTLKIAYWLIQTRTGLLDEMKFYGEERTMLDIYRCRETESSIWRSEYESKIQNIPILIVDAYNFSKQSPDRYAIIKDIPLLEDIVRRKSSQEISFDRFYRAILSLGEDEIRIHMTDMISIIREIYETIPERPTGPLISPPGTHGETYFITQKMLWHRGQKWLIHASKTLENTWKTWKIKHQYVHPRQKNIDILYIERCIAGLVRYHTLGDTNTNIILTIHDGETRITYISRDVTDFIQRLFSGSTAYGVNISKPETSKFLMREYGLSDQKAKGGKSQMMTSLTHIEYHAQRVNSGTVILTTSLKHARDLGSELRKIHGKDRDILIQGLSGGKGKMLSLFAKNIHKTIVIGLIDTWRDEYTLWSMAQHIIITRLPFDPPTDPYFLARTVGMSNHFSEYSEPIVAIRINTLIDRILSSGYSGLIYVCDSRLLETEWGKKIHKELL